MEQKLYRCFDTNLKKYLLDNGFRYELIAKDVISNKKMWIFIISDDLENHIKIWENNSPKKNI